MDASEIQQLERLLREELDEAGYGWILEEVEALARENRGEPATDSGGDAALEARLPSEDPRRRVLDLVSALRYTLVEGMRLRAELREHLLDDTADVLRIGDGRDDERAIVVTRDPAVTRDDVERLLPLLDRLQEMLS
jgi:hypothetical protein